MASKREEAFPPGPIFDSAVHTFQISNAPFPAADSACIIHASVCFGTIPLQEKGDTLLLI